jgi:hypothetical protein
MNEHDIQDKIRVYVSENQLATLFRANVGESWTGNKIERTFDGRIIIYQPRRLSTGLPPGFPDLFGFKTVIITPDIVGRQVAVFAFLEVKQPGKKPTEKQAHMIDFLKKNGAIGGVARSPEETDQLLKGKESDLNGQ